jgi:hypothetical protein
MFEKFNPEVKKILISKSSLINNFSTESKLNILQTASTGNVKALRQEIDYINLGGDY